MRHAVAAARLVQFDQSGQLALKVRCITREAFEQVRSLSPSRAPRPSQVRLPDDFPPPPRPQLVGNGHASALLSRSEGVLVLTLTGTPTSSPSLAPVSLLVRFGEVRALKVVEERFHVVEYWDDRAAERAHEVLDGREQGGARFECSFEPGVAVRPSSPSRASRRRRPDSRSLSRSQSTDSPSWTTTATSTTSQNVAEPLDPFLPPTPAATPRSTTSFDRAYLSSPAPSSTFSFGSAALAKPFTSSVAPSQPHWTASRPPVTPAGFLRLNPSSPPPPPQQHQQQSLFTSSTQPRPSTASTASTVFADGPRALATLPAWPAKHRSHIGQEYGIVRDDRIPASNVLNFERIERGASARPALLRALLGDSLGSMLRASDLAVQVSTCARRS